MSKENKIVELTDEELEKVSGGYTNGNHKEVGFAFYSDSNTSLVYKITKVEGFISEQQGYSYSINCYMSNYDGGFVSSLTDAQIDNYVRQFGQPKSN